MQSINDIADSGWVLAFDVKESFDSNLDQNELFTPLNDDEYLIFETFVLPIAFSDHLKDVENFKGEDARSFEDFRELFRSDQYYKLPAKFNKSGIDVVCSFIKTQCLWFPHTFYFNGQRVQSEQALVW